MENAARFHEGLNSLGLTTGRTVSPVVGVVLETIPEAIMLWNTLLSLGLYVNLSLPPATPDHHPLLRCSVMATHTSEQIDRAVEIFREAMARLPASA